MSIAEPAVLTEPRKAQGTSGRLRSIASIQYSWTALAGILILWAILSALYIAVLRETGGTFIYTIDDAYISAAMGRNLAQHGVLGVTRYGFTSSSSSIIWPFLLALLDLLLRVPEYTPLILNIALGTGLIAFFYALLRRAEPRAPSGYIFFFIGALILCVPLPVLVFTGLEHILHIIAAVGFAYFASIELANELSTTRFPRALLGFAALVTLVRFEGMFMVAVVAALFVLRSRWRRCAQVLAAGFAPVVIYGLAAKAAGWFFLPSSVLAKSTDPSNLLRNILSFDIANKIFVTSEVQVVFLVAAVLFLGIFMRTGNLWNRNILLLVIFLTTTVVHVRVAKIGILFRYEAYLIALGLFVIGCALYEEVRQIYPALQPRALVSCGVILFVLWNEGTLLVRRARAGLKYIPMAAKNTYEQQYQMGRFLARYYPGAVVVANDIGAINFFADVHCIDMAGLGTKEITKLILEQRMTAAAVSALANEKQAQIAIIYAQWYGPLGALPSDWVGVGSWAIDRNVVEAEDRVFFFAIKPTEVAPLMRHLREFSGELPPSVHQEGEYLR